MNFLKNIGRSVADAASYLGEKSRKTAYLSRIRTVIRCEERAADREYLALGRYYYNNLRDKNNPVTEAHCAELEAIEVRLEKALNQLEQFYQADGKDSDCVIVESEDGPSAAFVAGGEIEEVTLDDVQAFDHDPEQPADPAAEPVPSEENADLPFEG